MARSRGSEAGAASSSVIGAAVEKCVDNWIIAFGPSTFEAAVSPSALGKLLHVVCKVCTHRGTSIRMPRVHVRVICAERFQAAASTRTDSHTSQVRLRVCAQQMWDQCRPVWGFREVSAALGVVIGFPTRPWGEVRARTER